MSPLTEDLERTIEEQRAEIARLTAERDKALAEVGCHHKPAVFDEHSRADLIRYGRRWLGLDATPGEGGGAR